MYPPLVDMLNVGETELNLSTKPSVILVIGVNGVGKTTSIGKMAHYYTSQGKKVVLAAADMLSGDMDDALRISLSIECIHTYSLIHDDLPCMDDDDLRRGKPTNHKVYGEATAVLAGFKMFFLPIATATDKTASPEQKTYTIIRDIIIKELKNEYF